MLLTFRVSNHRSLRDEQELSLVAVPRKGEPKPSGPIPPTVRVAGIYGANASGKSNVLHALEFFSDAVRDSYAKWPTDGGVPRQPFLLGPTAVEHNSRYEIDLAIDAVRFTYGFEVDNNCVRAEWLYSYHSRSRRRILFQREGSGYSFGRTFSGPNLAIARLVRENALYLSVAAINSHSVCSLVHSQILKGFPRSVLRLGQGHPVVPMLARLPAAADVFRVKVNEWLRLADLGVAGFELKKSAIPAGRAEWFNRVVDDLRDLEGRGFEAHGLRIEDLAQDALFGELRLLHDCEPSGTPVGLPLDAESAGTQIWLALNTYVEGAIRGGKLLLIDEVDSSLHPKLSAALLQVFKDPVINPKGAQLIFTSHDVSLLGNLVEDDILGRDEVWFTEKDNAGATTLFPLSDFRPRKGENFERAYLQGRYGAVPYVDIAQLRRMFQRKDAS